MQQKNLITNYLNKGLDVCQTFRYQKFDAFLVLITISSPLTMIELGA